MELVKITIDGQEVEAPKGELLIEACEMSGIYLPRFCHFRGLTAQASCRMCVVRVDNPKIPKLQTACTMPVSDGMVVTTTSEEIETVRKSMIEFLLSNHPVDCPVCDRAGECELQDQTYGFGTDSTRSKYADKEEVLERQISPFIYNDPQRCVTCKRCTRVCEEWMDEFAITVINRGAKTFIGSHSGWVECSDCGNCVDVCPTGTLLHVPYKYVSRPWDLKQTPTVCNFCSDGCSMLAGSRSEKLVRVVARDGRGRTAGGINPDFLCSLGRYTVDTVHSPERIERPMIRRGHHLVPATWDEAMHYIAVKLGEIKSAHGADSIGFITSARLSNEDQHVYNRFASEVVGTKNREFFHQDDELNLGALMGKGSPTIATQKHLQSAETILVIGTDPNEENPLTAFSIRWAVRRNSARLVMVNSVASRLERQAELALRVRPGGENAILWALLDESQTTEASVISGVSQEEILAARKILVESEKVVVVVGSQLRGAALSALRLMDSYLATPAGEVAAEARKAHLAALQKAALSTNSTQKPAINENPFSNITPQPTLEVGYEPVRSETKFCFLPLVRFANSMGAFLTGMDSSVNGGLSAREMIGQTGNTVRALYVAGEDLASRDGMIADLARLEFLVVQDEFLNETAQMANVVLPGTSYAESQGTQVNNGLQVQLLRRVIPPIGQARPDWIALSGIARLMGTDFGYQANVKSVFKEISERVPGFAGLSHNRLASEGALQVSAGASGGEVNSGEILGQLAKEAGAIDRHVAVDRGEVSGKAGTILRQRYPQVTRYSKMLPLHPTNGVAEARKAVVFPA